ncbi:MAG: type IV conjugative transfer system protein TraE [Dictyoglomus turgidum]
MELKKYLEEKANYAMSNRILRFFVIVIGVAFIVQSFVMYTLWKSQKVILVPPNLSSQAYISGSDASQEYLRAMARYVMTLGFCYSPGTVRSQLNDLLKLFSPEEFPSYKQVFYKIASDSEAAAVSSSFFVSKIEVDKDSKEITVTGVLNQWTQDKKFITDEVRTYKLRYAIQDGMFLLKELKEVKR